MNNFELQWITARSRPEDRIGVILFDKNEQQLRHILLNNIPVGEAAALATYLQKEFNQMQQVMASGLPFTPFASVTHITAQLLPGDDAPIRFSEIHSVVALNIDQALLDAKSSLSP